MSWYKTWWGVILLVLISVIVVGVLVFTVITAWYWRQIKTGKIDANNIKGAISTKFNLTQDKRQQLETSDDPYTGSPSAKIVIVEFVDYKCPNCQASYPIMKKVMDKYSHKVKLITRDFPGESIHPGATDLSVMAYCAHIQNKFTYLQDILFEQQNYLSASLSLNERKAIYSSASLDVDKMETCLVSDQAKIEVNKDFSDGVKFGVVGTPTFFVNGEKVQGVVSYDNWVKVIEEIK